MISRINTSQFIASQQINSAFATNDIILTKILQKNPNQFIDIFPKTVYIVFIRYIIQKYIIFDMINFEIV